MDIVILIVSLLTVVAVSGFGGYKVAAKHNYDLGVTEGRVAEREDLTKALEDSIETTYRIGRNDATRDCRDGLIK